MNILILGGTGAMGIHLTRILSDRGYECFVTSRTQRCNKDNVTYIQGDAHQASCLIPLLNEKWDAIVDFMIYSTSDFTKLAPFFLKATKQYFFFSSGRVFADVGETCITEDSPRLLDVCKDTDYLVTDEYALAKARQEDILRNSGKKNWTIVRPYVTYAESRLQLSCMEKESWLWRAIHHRSIVIAESLANKVTTFTYGYDVARSISALIGSEGTLGESFNLTGCEYKTWDEILDIYLSVFEAKMGFKPRVFRSRQYSSYHGGGSLQVKYDRLYNRRFDNSKLNKYIDTSTFYSIEKGLQICLSTFLSNPEFKYVNWGDELRKDVEARDLVLYDIPGKRAKICQLMRFMHLKN